MLRHSFSTFFITAIAVVTTSTCLAKNINLYDQPTAQAKIVGTIDPANGIVPIFTPKAGDWIKIGDPHNGNVGWVKSSDLAHAGPISNGFTFTQSITNNGAAPESYVMHFGAPPHMTPEQSAAFFKQIQTQQSAIQKDMQNMVQDIFNNAGVKGFNYPVIMPVIVMPQQPATPQK